MTICKWDDVIVLSRDVSFKGKASWDALGLPAQLTDVNMGHPEKFNPLGPLSIDCLVSIPHITIPKWHFEIRVNLLDKDNAKWCFPSKDYYGFRKKESEFSPLWYILIKADFKHEDWHGQGTWKHCMEDIDLLKTSLTKLLLHPGRDQLQFPQGVGMFSLW